MMTTFKHKRQMFTKPICGMVELRPFERRNYIEQDIEGYRD